MRHSDSPCLSAPRSALPPWCRQTRVAPLCPPILVKSPTSRWCNRSRNVRSCYGLSRPCREQCHHPSRSRPAATQQYPSSHGRCGVIWWCLPVQILRIWGQAGINIAAPEGTVVKTAANGVVAYAGDELKGYGKLVLISHGNGWVTAYAFNSKLLVKRWDQVRQGQSVALVGHDVDTFPQLHFEIRRGSQPLNPLDYLPNR